MRIPFTALLLALPALLEPLPAWAGGRHAGGAFLQPHWAIRSNFALSAPMDSMGTRLAVSSTGKLWAVGAVSQLGGYHVILRQSADNGTTWSTKADFAGYPLSLAIDGSDHLYILGSALGSDLKIWKSQDEGASWTDITIPGPSEDFAWEDFAVSPDGNTLYLAGNDGIAPGYPWIVAKSTDAGASWTTVNSFRPPTTEMGQVTRIAVNWASNAVWVVGAGTDDEWNPQWYVRKSTDAGATWNTSDVRTAGGESQANDIAWDGSGNIYVVGYETDSSWSTTYWTVSRSSDGGATWTTVDYHPGTDDWSGARSIAISPSGTIFVGGYFWERGGTSGDLWAVRKSTDGTTWETVDTYQIAAGQNADAHDVALAGTDLFVIGFSGTTTTTSHWLVRRSSDQGTSFEVSDDFAPVGPRSTTLDNALMDAAGTLYLSGSLDSKAALILKSLDGGLSWSENLDPTSYSDFNFYPAMTRHPVTGVLYAVGQRETPPTAVLTIRKSTDDGASWSTISTMNSYASALLVAPSGDLYLLLDNPWLTPRRWVIQRSQDDGQTWTVVDDYADTDCSARSIAHGPGGFFATGYCSLGGQPTRWIVRKSLDGTTWSPVDSYLHAAGKDSQAQWVTVLTNGVVLVSGTGIDATNKRHALIRRSADGGSTWTTVDDYLPPSITSVIARGFTVDVTGRIYSAGYTQGAADVWYVRASADGGLTWRNSDRYFPGSIACQAMGVVASPVDAAVYAVGHAGAYSSATKALVRRMR